MKTADIRFLEEFKRLEAFCNDVFSCQSGVSEYIAHMEQADARGKAAVADWAEDYKRLKHLRWVRNQIAHSPDTDQLSKTEDLKQLQEFYDRLLSQRDPLALLEKAKKAASGKTKTARTVRTSSRSEPKPAPASAAKKPPAAKPTRQVKKPSGNAGKTVSHTGAAVLLIVLILLILLGLAVLYLDVSGILPIKELADNAGNAITGLLKR